MSKNKKRPYIIELRLYEFLGIKIFKKLTLELESFRHRKDDSKNINYHFHGNGIHSVKNFTGYLLYNAVCHIISLALVIVYFSTKWFIGTGYFFLDISMCILFLLNIYCIMLQRYTFIKTCVFIEKWEDIHNNRVADKIEYLFRIIQCKDCNELMKEFMLIKKIQECIHNGTECVIEECDIIVLHNISQCVCGIFKTNSIYQMDNNEEELLINSFRRVSKSPLVTNEVTHRAAYLQNLFGFDKSNNLFFEFSIITENRDCENAYRDLIQNNTRDSFEFIIDVLFGAYSKALLSLRRTQV